MDTGGEGEGVRGEASDPGLGTERMMSGQTLCENLTHQGQQNKEQFKNVQKSERERQILYDIRYTWHKYHMVSLTRAQMTLCTEKMQGHGEQTCGCQGGRGGRGRDGNRGKRCKLWHGERISHEILL